MIRFDVKQGSPAWHAARTGIPTASCFGKMLTPKDRRPSKQSEAYARFLATERIVGEAGDLAASGFMERGKAMEPEAVKYYELATGETVDRVGFVTTDDGRIGCSPDGLIGEDGGLEIKILSAANHFDLVLRHRAGEDVADDEYQLQVQGGMWVCERKWWDRLWWHPTMKSVIVRVERDEATIAQLAAAVYQSADRVDRLEEAYYGNGKTTDDG